MLHLFKPVQQVILNTRDLVTTTSWVVPDKTQKLFYLHVHDTYTSFVNCRFISVLFPTRVLIKDKFFFSCNEPND